MLEPMPRRKKKGRILSVLIVVSVAAAFAAFLYNYGPFIYYKYIDTSGIYLLQNREEQIRRMISEGDSDLQRFYAYLKDSLRMTSNLEKKFSAHPGVYYYHGLFRLYDFLIRVPLNPESLLNLAGRKYLPSERSLNDIPPADSVTLAHEISVYMRKSMALGLSGDPLRLASFAAVAGDLYYTGRTDPALLEQLQMIPEKNIPPELIPAFRWMHIALLVIQGKPAELTEYFRTMDSPDSVKPLYSHLLMNEFILNQTEKDLLTAYANLHSRNYIPALLAARSVRMLPDADPVYKTEAGIIEAEVFYYQRGPAAALQLYSELKKELDYNDTFIDDRIRQLQPGRESLKK